MSHEALGFPGISGNGFQSHITTEREKKWRETGGNSPEGHSSRLTIAALPLYTADMKISSACTGGHFCLQTDRNNDHSTNTPTESAEYKVTYITYCVPTD